MPFCDTSEGCQSLVSSHRANFPLLNGVQDWVLEKTWSAWRKHNVQPYSLHVHTFLFQLLPSDFIK